MKIKEFYHKNHKKLFIIPMLLFAACIAYLIIFFNQNNDVIYKDVSLKGGISATVYTDKEISIENLQKTLLENIGESSVRKLAEFGSDKQLGILIELSSTDEAKLKTTLEEYFGIKLSDDNYSVEVAGANLGKEFYGQMIKALIFAFIFMGIVVFIRFRTFIPSIAVVAAAAGNILVTMTVMDIIGQRISTGGIAAFLLMIGYSIDTDILLTTRVLKRNEGSYMDRIESSFKTGITMTLATFIATLLGYIFSTSLVLKEIFLIITIGMIVDVIMTYLMNTSILLMYVERKKDG